MTLRNIFLIDGATGSELDRRGVDISMPLWSARALIEAPEPPKILKQVHLDYLNAGAQAITANTFRTHQRSLAKAGIGDRAEELTQLAVAIARSACDEGKPDALVYGSVAPLEDCYSPELAPDIETCKQEHGQMIQCLVEAGVDLVLIETMCSAHEAIAAAEAARELTPNAWAISFCLSTDGLGFLLDGTHISEVIPAIDGAQFVGINCVPAPMLADQVQHLRQVLPDNIPIAAFGNVGYADEDGGWVSTDAIEPDRYASYAMDWIDAGATIIGGCCGTTPKTIKSISNNLE
jgi:homocysteine S-methyltransferase